MTVSTTTNKVVYSGSGSAGPFSIAFYVADEDHLVVTRRVTATEVETLQTLTTDYTTTGEGSASGTLTLVAVLPSTETLTIERVFPLTQSTDLPVNGPFPAVAVEDMSDKLTYINQQINTLFSRTLKIKTTSGFTLPDIMNPSSGKVLIYDGTDLKWESVVTLGASTTVTDFMLTVLDDTTAAAAMATLLAANDLTVKTADGAILNLQTSDTTVTAASVLGRVDFTAPNEASGTDALLLAASIAAVSEGTFGTTDNATKLSFQTGASEAAAEKMSISSVGNVTMKQTATTDNTPMTLSLTTGEVDIQAADVLGKIEWSAPDEGTGTDSRLVSGAIDCVSEGDFSTSNNASKLSFRTGASEAATEKMQISSTGNVTMKQTATGDDTPMTLSLQTGEIDIAAADVLGKIEWSAPDEGTGTDALLVAGAIDCVSEGDFSSSSNASKLSFRTGASETATEKMSISSAGAVTMTGDVTMAGDVTLSATDGAAITGVASINAGQIGGSRNFIYNGDFQIFQRAASASSLGNGSTGYHVHDRWQYGESGAPNAVVTWTGDTETPDGFNSSMKLACTTASGTVAVGDVVYIAQIFEGYDLQSWNKGDAQAKAVTLSFWVRSTKIGTYIVSLHDNDNNRHISKAYTVSSTNTWEYKTLTFAGDTSTLDPFGNDNATSLYVQWPLVAGANYTDGTLATSWAEWNDGNSYVGQVDALDSTSNLFYMTGVQLELGSTATAFQYEHYGENLIRCQRYFTKRAASAATLFGDSAGAGTGGYNYSHWQFHTTMRAVPTMTGLTGTPQQINVDSAGGYANAGTYTYYDSNATASAELS
jgi:hypothetical protein